MARFILLSVSGHDRPGIVRDVAEALLHVNANIEDSSMTALRGRFTMMLIVRLAEDSSMATIKAALADLEQRSGLTVQSQVLAADEADRFPPEPDYVVTVTGADRPGIVHAVADVLASLGISIVDLSTRSRKAEHGDVYMMAMEVAVGKQIAQLKERLAAVAEKMQVDVEVHPLDTEIL